MPILSLAHMTVLDAAPVELVEVARTGGFNAVGLRVVAPPGHAPVTPVVDDRALQGRLKRRLSDLAMTVLDIEAFWIEPDTRVDAWQAALETGAALGARHALTIGFDPDRSRLIDRFGAFCALAHRCGLRTMLEFMPASTVPDLKSAHDLLTAAAPDDAGLLVDALHLARSGTTLAEIADLDPALFSYVHLCDAAAVSPPADGLRLEGRFGRLYPGEGALDLEAFLKAFPAGTPIAVEAPSAKHADLPVAMRAALAGEAAHRVLKAVGDHSLARNG